MAKQRQIYIAETELSPQEVQKVLHHRIFSRFGPRTCNDCGCADNFPRRIFRIKGIPASKQSDDDLQELLSLLFLIRYEILWVFYRSVDRKFYADSAICPKCGATAIVYNLDPGQLAAWTKRRAGEEETRAALDAFRKKLGWNEWA